MIRFPGDDQLENPTGQSYGAFVNTGGAERFNMINANKITVFDIDASTASIKDATIITAKIGNLEVTNAKINDVSAAKITTGVLQASQAIIVGAETGARIEILGGASGTAAIQIYDASAKLTGQIISNGQWWFGSSDGSDKLYWDGSSFILKTAGTAGGTGNSGLIVADGNNNEVGRINNNAFVARQGKAFAVAVDNNFNNWGQMFGLGGEMIFEAPSGGTENIKFMSSGASAGTGSNVFTITTKRVNVYKVFRFLEEAADPTDADMAVRGAVYYNTTSNVLRFHNGTAWGNV